jgi:hypothetical protein
LIVDERITGECREQSLEIKAVGPLDVLRHRRGERGPSVRRMMGRGRQGRLSDSKDCRSSMTMADVGALSAFYLVKSRISGCEDRIRIRVGRSRARITPANAREATAPLSGRQFEIPP